MDKFKHSDNILLNRRDLFDVLQDMIYSGIDKWIKGIYQYENLKIVCGNSEIGLLTDDNFRVNGAYPQSYITVQPGVATNDGTSLIYNDAMQTIDVSALADGMYYVHAKYKQNKGLTGKELPLPPKGYINTEDMYTMLTDACEIEVGISYSVPGAILLAGVAVDGAKVPAPLLGNLTGTLYASDQNIAFPATLPSSSQPWHVALVAVNRRVVKVGNEYILVDGSGDILQRGAYRTVIEHHNEGSPYYIMPVIDYRQDSLLTMRGQDDGNSYLDSGMLMVGGNLRSVATRNLVPPPAAPTLALPSSPFWVTRSSAMGLMTSNIVAIYQSLQTTAVTIANLRAQIDDINNRILGMDDDDPDVLHYQAELARYHSELIRALAVQQTQLGTLSNSEIRSYQNAGADIFELIVNITPAPSAEKVVQYELQITRGSVSSMANSDHIYAETVYSLRSYPTGYNDSGDPIYDPLDRRSSQVRIPVHIGERVVIRARAINENDVYGEYSSEYTYAFSDFADSDYITYKNIYDMLSPDIVYGYQTLREALNYLQDATNRMRNVDSAIDGLRTMMTTMSTNIQTLWPLDALIPHIPALINLVSYHPPHPEPGPGAVPDNWRDIWELLLATRNAQSDK